MLREAQKFMDIEAEGDGTETGPKDDVSGWKTYLGKQIEQVRNK